MRTTAMCRECRECGVPVSRGAPFGLCAKCLLALGFVSETEPEVVASQSRRSLGDYELLDQIGRGGMGAVYRARQLSLHREVALKMVLPGDLTKPGVIKRFEIEAEAAAKLQHPHIVPIFETGRELGHHYFTMQLIHGENLHQCHANVKLQSETSIRSKTEAREAQSRIACLINKIARAVHYAHEQGVLHRDIKPSNILINQKGEPFLTDFGLAKVFDRVESVTTSAAVLGTLNYMAPEQAAGRRTSRGADIFSLGVILYELLTGVVPFRGSTPAETLRNLAEQEPVNPRGHNRWVEPDLATICLKCLQKRPEERYASADQLGEDLERWIRCEPVHARPISATVRVRRWMQRNRMATALLAALTFGLGASLWLLLVVIQQSAETRNTSSALGLGLSDFLSQRSLPYFRIRSASMAAFDGRVPKGAAALATRSSLGVLLHQNPSETARYYNPLSDYLEQAMSKSLDKGLGLDLILYDNMSAEDLKSSQPDFVRIDPLRYGEVTRAGIRLTPVVRTINSQLRCYIVVPIGMQVASLSALKNWRLYFGESNSIVTVFAKALLAKNGLSAGQFKECKYVPAEAPGEYVQGGYYSLHSDALSGLSLSNRNAAVVLERQLLQSQGRTNYAVLGSFDVPDSFWVATTNASAKAIKAFQKAMHDLPPSSRVLGSLPDNPVKPEGFVDASPSDYAPVESAMQMSERFEAFNEKSLKTSSLDLENKSPKTPVPNEH